MRRQHIMSNGALAREWTTFDGNMPILHHTACKVHGDSDIAYGEKPRTSVLMELHDRVGILHDVLKYFWKFDINICRIESRPVKGGDTQKQFDFFIDFEGSLSDRNVR